MAYDAATGMWKPETTGNTTAEKVTGMLTAGNPYIEQAKSAGLDVANSRGLLNSSIAAGASEKAAYDAATPIATADASIAAQKDLSKQSYVQTADISAKQSASTERIAAAGNESQQVIAGNNNQKDLSIADMNVASNKQDKASTAAQNYANIYATQVNTINNNKDIPASSRATYLEQAKTQYDDNIALVEQMYSVKLDWGASSAAAGGASATPAAPTFTPTQQAGFSSGNPPPGYFATGNGTYTDGTNVIDANGNYLGPASTAAGHAANYYSTPDYNYS